MSCRDCVFRGIFQDMGASCDVCNLQSDLADAIKACEDSDGCRHRFTVSEAKEIVIDREGGLPVITKEEKKEECKVCEEYDPFKTIREALIEAGKAACMALKTISNNLQKAQTESEDTQND